MPCLSSRNIPIPPSVRALFPTNELVRQRIREEEGDRGEEGDDGVASECAETRGASHRAMVVFML